MNDVLVFHSAADFFRGNELSSGFLNVPDQREQSMDPQTSSVVGGKREAADVISPEREKQLEAWMEQVRVFIRNIDIDRL